MDCTNRWRASIQCHSTLWRSSSKGFAECCRTMINMPSKSDSCGFKVTRVRYWRSAIRASISFQKHCTTSASINGLLQPTSGIFQRSVGRLLLSTDPSDTLPLQLVTNASDPPTIASIKAKLHVQNIYSIIAMKETVAPDEAGRN